MVAGLAPMFMKIFELLHTALKQGAFYEFIAISWAK